MRHGHTIKRSMWNRPKEQDKETGEAARLLTHDQGETRARALIPILTAYEVGRAIINPWKCCMSMVAPCTMTAGLDLEVAGALTEMAHAQSPRGARSMAKKVLHVREEPTVLCTHRPALPAIMEVVS